MRILVLAPHPYYITRGTPIDLDLLLQALSDGGHEVDAVVYAEGEDRGYSGVRLHRVGGWSVLHGTRPGFSFRKLILDVLLFIRAWRLVRRNDYDVVHAGEEAAFLAMFFRRFYGLEFVYDMDSSVAQQMVESYPLLSPLSALFNRIEAAAIRRSIVVAPVCNALADLARRRGAPHVVTLHDISQLEPDAFQDDGALRKALGIEGLILMYVGNLEEYQGVDLLLEAMTYVSADGIDLDLVIAGGSDTAIRRYGVRARELGVDHRTHFIGPWPYADLGALLGQADILTAPRLRGINTPMKVFPYLHSGKPVLVTDLPTHNQILNEELAALAAPNAEEFGQAIVTLAKDPDRRARLGAAGRRFVEAQHTLPAYRRRVQELYCKVHEEISSPSPTGMAIL